MYVQALEQKLVPSSPYCLLFREWGSLFGYLPLIDYFVRMRRTLPTETVDALEIRYMETVCSTRLLV